METHNCCSAGKMAHHRNRPEIAGEADGPARGKSAQSVGHRARALVAEAHAEGRCLSQGKAASTIARGIDSASMFVEAVTVNLSYTSVATTLAAAAPDGIGDPVGTAPEHMTETPPAAGQAGVPAATDPDAEATDPEETAGPAEASGGQISVFYIEAQATYMSASIALDLLR